MCSLTPLMFLLKKKQISKTANHGEACEPDDQNDGFPERV